VRERYHLGDGIVLRRRLLPSGDAIITLLSERGKWTALARSGRSSAGLVASLSLFNDVTVQHYRRKEGDLPVITQVTLNGMLPRLSEPGLYGFAHILAELADQLTVDVSYDEPLYAYLASGLRGLCSSDDPELVTIAYAWRMVKAAGLAPAARGCPDCGSEGPLTHLDIPAGLLRCGDCGGGARLEPATAAELKSMLTGTLTQAITRGLADREAHWRVLDRFVAHHVNSLSSLSLRTRPEREAANA